MAPVLRTSPTWPHASSGGSSRSGSAIALAAAATWAALTDHAEAGLDLGIAALAVGGVSLLVAQMGRAPRIDLGVDDGVLVVRFRGWDALWALRREVRIPLRQIERVDVRHVDSVHVGWWRHRGTDLPGVIKAGSFVSGGARELWDVRRGADAVDVELEASAHFRRLVLELPDPAAAAERLRASAGPR